MTRVRKAVIPAAGMGTRFYPLTRAQPKEMLPILDKPVIHYVVEEAVNSGLDQILIIVGYGKDAIVNYFDRNSLDEKFDDKEFSSFPDIYFVRQKEQLGLAHALKSARNFVNDDPFVVLLGDTIYRSSRDGTVTSDLIDVFSKYGNSTITVEEVPEDKIQDYGIIDAEPAEEDVYRINRMVEKPNPEDAPSNLGVTGLYALTSDIFQYIDRIEPGRNGEYQLADVFNLMTNDVDIMANTLHGTRYDVGTKELWVKTFIEFAQKDKRFTWQ